MTPAPRAGRLPGLAAALLPWPALAGPPPAPDAPEFVARYLPPDDSDYAVFENELRRERFLDTVAEGLNRTLVLPARVTLRLADCEASTTRWDAADRTVTVCYEFLDAVVAIAASDAPTQARTQRLFSGAVTFALFSEIGAALIDLYGLPTPRGAREAADEFAAVTLAAAEPGSDGVPAAAVEFFDLALQLPDSGLDYLDGHAFGRARLETLACLLYGNAPQNHGAALQRGTLSAARAPQCAEELLAAAKTWDRQLREHARPEAIARP